MAKIVAVMACPTGIATRHGPEALEKTAKIMGTPCGGNAGLSRAKNVLTSKRYATPIR